MASDSLENQVQRLNQAFAKKAVELSSLLHVAIEEASILVEGRAAALAPVDTGLLRKSITHRLIERKGYPIGQVGTNVEYAPFQEFGTSKMAAQPFLLPALNQSRTTVNDIIARRLRTAL